MKNISRDSEDCGFFVLKPYICQMQKRIIICLITSLFFHRLYSQHTFKNFFEASDSLNNKRFYLATGFSALSYSSFSLGLYYAWYKKNELVKFHSFNDWNEWYQMDKMGHCYTTYLQNSLIYDGSRWIGMNRKNSILWGIGLSNLFQTTIEIMDGLNKKWGFSWSDIGANLTGNVAFVSQQLIWDEQKLLLKFSTHKNQSNYSDPIINERIDDLYSNRLIESLLKDYNGQTYWISFHPVKTFIDKSTFWPDYLNLAIGYGVNGLLGAHENSWTNTQGEKILLDPITYPRSRQYYLSLDINLKKIPVKNHFVKSLFSIINIVKIPAPALEFDSNNKLKFHPFYY